jgi:ribosome-associated heat shock protein Hsp15
MGTRPAAHVTPATQRLDKWLWFARVVKSRTLAAELVTLGKVRVNRVRAAKASQMLRPGDVLTLALAGRVRVLRVVAPGERRGPAVEARRLYELVHPAEEGASGTARGPGGEGRERG